MVIGHCFGRYIVTSATRSSALANRPTGGSRRKDTWLTSTAGMNEGNGKKKNKAQRSWRDKRGQLMRGASSTRDAKQARKGRLAMRNQDHRKQSLYHLSTADDSTNAMCQSKMPQLSPLSGSPSAAL